MITSKIALITVLSFIAFTLMSTGAFGGSEGTAPGKDESGKADVQEKDVKAAKPVVLMKTSMGDVRIELFEKEAPITVKNFLAYVEGGFFDGTIFHRVIPGFVIQGGGFTPDMNRKTTKNPIKNEADNGLKNLRGTLSMARTNVIDSATSQFFVSLVDNSSLDHVKGDANRFGYAVFGRVSEGMDVVDRIAKVKTTSKGPNRDVPADPIVIKSFVVLQ